MRLDRWLRIVLGLGDSWLQLEEWGKARAEYECGLDCATKAGDLANQAAFRARLGFLAACCADLRGAVEHFKATVWLRKDAGDDIASDLVACSLLVSSMREYHGFAQAMRALEADPKLSSERRRLLASRLEISRQRYRSTVRPLATAAKAELGAKISAPTPSPELMKRVWLAVAPDQLRSLPEATSSRRDTGFPDAWLKQYVTGVQSSSEADWALTLEYVAELAFEIIRQRPSCLVGPAQAAAYLDEAPLPPAKLQSPLSPETLTPVLKSLLDWGLRVNDKHVVSQEVRNGVALGRPIEETIEAAFARLRSNRIEIHVHAQYLDALLGGESAREPQSVYARGSTKNTAEPFRLAEDALFYEL